MTKQPTKIIPKISGNVDYPEDTDVLETTLKYAVPKNALRKAMGLWNYLKDRKGTLLERGWRSVRSRTKYYRKSHDRLGETCRYSTVQETIIGIFTVLQRSTGYAYSYEISSTARL